MKRRHQTCPQPHKRPYATADVASGSASQFARKLNQAGTLCEPLYTYRCRAGHWHLTRQREHRGVTNALVLMWPAELQRWAMTKAPERTP